MPKFRKHLDARFYDRLDQLTGHMTFHELGNLTGMPAESCRRYVHGIVKPSVDWLARLCTLSGASLDWLVRGIGKAPKVRK